MYAIRSYYDQIAAGRVQHALRLARRSRRIQDEQRVLRAHFLARAVRIDLGLELVQPRVTVLVPADVRRATINVAVGIVEDVLVRHRRVDDIAAGRVQHALRFAGP